MTYEQYKRWILDVISISPQKSVPLIDLVAGSLAGATAVMFTYPLDLVRTRLAFQVEKMRLISSNRSYKSQHFNVFHDVFVLFFTFL